MRERKSTQGGRFSSKPGARGGRSFGGRFGGRGGDADDMPFSKRRSRKFGPEVMAQIDCKSIDILRNFISEKGKILPRRITGLTSKEQRRLSRTVKQSRHAALLPFDAK